MFGKLRNGSGQIQTAGRFSRLAGYLIAAKFLTTFALAQPGGLDPSFASGTILSGSAPATVYALAVQSNGHAVIAGDFTTVQGVTRNRIARLTPGGGLDPAFAPVSGANGTIRCVLVQTDGRILIGGEFTTYDGVPRNRIARLLPGGTLDTTFNPGTGANGTVHAMALNASSSYGSPNRPVLIGGEFTTFNGTAKGRITQLTSTGVIDPNFNIGSGANGPVYAIQAPSDPNGANLRVVWDNFRCGFLVAGAMADLDHLMPGNI